MNRAWRYRLYPSKTQERKLHNYLRKCKNLWNRLLEYTKIHHEKTGKFPTRNQLYAEIKNTQLFSQVAQNVADRLAKSLRRLVTRKKSGLKAGFPRFKPIERMKSFTYPQFGFKLEERLELSGIKPIAIKKHRNIQGRIKTLTIKKSPSGKWFAIFTTETELAVPQKKTSKKIGIDLGIEHFAYLSNGEIIENARHLKQAEELLRKAQRRLSSKKKGSKNRKKAKHKVAVAYEKLSNRRHDFLHKISRKLVDSYSFIALEKLNVAGIARSFLAKHVLDCSWADFINMLHYKAEEAGCEVVLVNPAHTSQKCSNCGLVQKKSLAERWHECICGASLHRDFNAAINILARATGGTPGSNACAKERNSLVTRKLNYLAREESSVHFKYDGQESSMKQETHGSNHR